MIIYILCATIKCCMFCFIVFHFYTIIPLSCADYLYVHTVGCTQGQWRTVGQRIGGGGGAPSGKVCVVTSVASFLVWGGEARPPNVPTKMYIYCASERLRNIYFQDSKYICLLYNQCIFLYLWYGAINDIILTKH